MAKPFAFLLTGAWGLLACLGSGCRENSSLQGASEVGMLYDYLVRRDSLQHGPFIVRPSRFFQAAEESDSANLGLG